MTSLWAFPVVVAIGGLMAVVMAASRSAEEARRLKAELHRLAALGPLLSDLREATGALATRSR